jgi:hypothetical protein
MFNFLNMMHLKVYKKNQDKRLSGGGEKIFLYGDL